MPRRKRVHKKQWKPDSKYHNLLLGRFLGQLMRDGKRSCAEQLAYDAFDLIRQEDKKGGLNTFEQAIKNVSPLLELRSKRIGGATYQVPVQVLGERRTALAMRWIIDATRSRKGKSMSKKLAEELLAASQKTGIAMKKREDTHRMAEANKAFAHFA